MLSKPINIDVLFILESFTTTFLRVNVFCITPYMIGYFQDDVKRETFTGNFL
jgi:hypothetical protein